MQCNFFISFAVGLRAWALSQGNHGAEHYPCGRARFVTRLPPDEGWYRTRHLHQYVVDVRQPKLSFKKSNAKTTSQFFCLNRLALNIMRH